MVDSKNLIMALLAWEEMRLSTLNKIFIRRMDFTMRKNGIVTVGRFEVSWSVAVDSPDVYTDFFHDWYSAYHAFRYHSSFLGRGYVSVLFRPDLRSPARNLVWRILQEGQVCIKWYEGRVSFLEGKCALPF